MNGKLDPQGDTWRWEGQFNLIVHGCMFSPLWSRFNVSMSPYIRASMVVRAAAGIQGVRYIPKDRAFESGKSRGGTHHLSSHCLIWSEWATGTPAVRVMGTWHLRNGCTVVSVTRQDLWWSCSSIKQTNWIVTLSYNTIPRRWHEGNIIKRNCDRGTRVQL